GSGRGEPGRRQRVRRDRRGPPARPRHRLTTGPGLGRRPRGPAGRRRGRRTGCGRGEWCPQHQTEHRATGTSGHFRAFSPVQGGGMTETASGPARRSRAKSGKTSKGLRVERVHTTPGVHPYDEVAWERRDVVMTNWREGSVNFEQRGVEFRDFWSVNAVNIVTSKYFRGALGSSQRETIIKQLIDRIEHTYRKAGEDHTYFASPADAVIFAHELAYALLHQIFSFNRPVWFNVGTPQPQQVSACFILSVDDSMESILDWYKEEGMIFKGGSGAGLNLSRIRSSKELLSSGGNASGPVSFMRGAD